nr:uncharacterized protein LOC127309983 [Lolium perenne]
MPNRIMSTCWKAARSPRMVAAGRFLPLPRPWREGARPGAARAGERAGGRRSSPVCGRGSGRRARSGAAAGVAARRARGAPAVVGAGPDLGRAGHGGAAVGRREPPGRGGAADCCSYGGHGEGPGPGGLRGGGFGVGHKVAAGVCMVVGVPSPACGGQGGRGMFLGGGAR